MDGNVGLDLGPEVPFRGPLETGAPGEESLRAGKRNSCHGHVPLRGAGQASPEAGPIR